MILGIVALVNGLLPFCGTWAIIPAFIGLILGVVDVALKTRRKQRRGPAIAGVILNPIAIAVIVLWWYFAAGAGEEGVGGPMVTGYPSGWSQLPQAGPQPGGQQIPLQPMQPVPDPRQPAPAMQPMQPVPPPAQNP